MLVLIPPLQPKVIKSRFETCPLEQIFTEIGKWWIVNASTGNVDKASNAAVVTSGLSSMTCCHSNCTTSFINV